MSVNAADNSNKEIAICAENLTKRYRLGVIGSTTLKADIQTRWAKMRGRHVCETCLCGIGASEC